MDMCLLIKGDVYWCRIRVAHSVQLKSVFLSVQSWANLLYWGGGATKANPSPSTITKEG